MLGACLLHGCAPESGGAADQSPLLTGRPSSGAGLPGVSDGPVAHPGGASQTLRVRTAVLPLGSVPYDNLSLPLVSPSGDYIVTQAGFPPTWATLRAEPDAEPPIDTRLFVYMITYKPGIPPALAATVSEPVLLGRGCNERGFLVEAPKSDGSRWIGLCAWSTGAIEWLVTGSDVNAFAAINREGDLAWCRRPAGDSAGNFELVVRRASGEEMKLATPGADWLMPSWCEQTDRLFAMQLQNGDLAATYHSLTSETALARPLFRLPIASHSTVDTAYQAMAPNPASSASSRVGTDQLIFFHPVHARSAIWQPLQRPERQFVVVPGDSIAAAVDSLRYAIVTTNKDLVRQDLFAPANRQEIVAGLQIPRPIRHEAWSYVLLSPSKPGQITLTALNLLPIHDLGR